MGRNTTLYSGRASSERLATRRKIEVFGSLVNGVRQSNPPPGRAAGAGSGCGRVQTLRSSLSAHHLADVDEIVGDHAESDPTLHSIVALISTAIEAIAPLDHADASFASGAPFLAVAEASVLGASAYAQAFNGL
jgi:hypothetical protein